MRGLKAFGWLFTAVVWGIKGAQIAPIVYRINALDGVLVGLAFSSVALMSLSNMFKRLAGE